MVWSKNVMIIISYDYYTHQGMLSDTNFAVRRQMMEFDDALKVKFHIYIYIYI